MSDKQRRIDHLLNKELTRKQFLGAMAGVVLSIFGFSGIIGLLTKAQPTKPASLGYGKQGYGP